MKTYYNILDWFVGLFVTPTLEQTAKNFAIRAHRSTNHKYDGKPYSVHLKMVVKYAKKYINLIPEDKRAIVIAACWLHDTIEDCRLTYNDIMEVFGKEVANIVYAVSNEKGKNRKQRANDKYYQGIRNNELAIFTKICDRLANVEYSKFDAKNKRMFNNYWTENPNFRKELCVANYLTMFDFMDIMLFEKYG